MSSNLIVTLLGLLTIVAVTVNIQKSKNLVENWNLGYPISPIGETLLRGRAGAKSQARCGGDQGLSAAATNSSLYQNVGGGNRNMHMIDEASPRGQEWRRRKRSRQFSSREEFAQSRRNPDGFLTVPGQYQSPLSPRFSNTQYGSNITYNLPQRKMLGVPRNPLSMANTVENYNGPSKPKNNSSRIQSAANPENDLLPAPDMDGSLVSAGPKNPILYHNLIWASKKSRTYQYGDPIRGDLPIVPCTDHKNRWFLPSANPSTSLNTGAMNVMGGYDNSTAHQTGRLFSAATGGAETASGGTSNPQNDSGTSIGIARENLALQAGANMTQERGLRYGKKLGPGPADTIAVSAFPM